ncbi:hypothetical protein BU15DRAFT_62775 [Melanogaster broomeanus]|nr:hypothetical protein BU15DRAFT_62775 [Melanogaster broomeanus]
MTFSPNLNSAKRVVSVLVQLGALQQRMQPVDSVSPACSADGLVPLFVHFLFPLCALDALSLFQEDELVIMSPNMTFIPKPFLNSSELRAFKDGCYGVQDVFQWPQLYSDKYPYSTCIPHREWLNFEPFHLLWWMPKPSDFVKEAGTVWEVGRLPEGHRAAFTELHDSIHDRLSQHEHYLNNDLHNLMKPAATLCTLKHALERLHYHPLTFRELTLQVAEFQRTALDILAYGHYVHVNAMQTSKCFKVQFSPVFFTLFGGNRTKTGLSKCSNMTNQTKTGVNRLPAVARLGFNRFSVTCTIISKSGNITQPTIFDCGC